MGRGQIIATISAGALMFTSALQAAETLDYAKINKNIADIVGTTLSQQGSISNLQLSIDGNVTNFDKNQFGANFSLVAPSTGWSKEAVQANGAIKVEVEQGKKGEEGKIEVKHAMTVKTDVLALLKFMVQKHEVLCQKADSIGGLNGLIISNKCKSIPKIKDAASLADIFAVIKDVHAEQIATLEAFVAEGNQNIAGISNVTLKQEAEKSIKKASKLLSIEKNAKLEATKDGGYIIESKDMDLTVISFFDGLKDLVQIDDSKVVLKDNEIKLACELDLLFGTKLYNAAKPELFKYMKGLEEGSEASKELLAGKIRIMLTLISEKLK